jgi:2-desacetyl-2-hydroxyethyl bacteriochlorophyllide A dehydrogenase
MKEGFLMKALVLKGIAQVEMAELPVPALGADQVLVRNKVCAVCNATDTKMYHGKHALATFPCVFGHEGAGVVEAVGEAVTHVRPGDRVLGAGYPASEGLGSFWGQYSEYGVAREAEVVQIPEGVTLDHAALSHMLGEALRIARLQPGEHVVIIGCGAVGLSLLTIVQHAYPATITMLDISDEKLALAKAMGATHAVNTLREDAAARLREITGGEGTNVLFEAVGSPKTYDLAYELLNRGGLIIPFGMIEGTLELPFRKLYAKQLQMRFVRSAGDHGAENKRLVLGMMQRGLIRPERLITARYPLTAFDEAARSILAGGQVRVLMDI